jgi:hypothetical protein
VFGTRLVTKAQVLSELRRAGWSEQTIQDLTLALPESVALDRDGDLLLRYGISHDSLVSAFGGSP